MKTRRKRRSDQMKSVMVRKIGQQSREQVPWESKKMFSLRDPISMRTARRMHATLDKRLGRRRQQHRLVSCRCVSNCPSSICLSLQGRSKILLVEQIITRRPPQFEEIEELKEEEPATAAAGT